MGLERKRGASSSKRIRDEEVVRAYRELTAYFRGTRTEREARAALKTLKAFIRERERLNPDSRPPLPALTARKDKLRARLDVEEAEPFDVPGDRRH